MATDEAAAFPPVKIIYKILLWVLAYVSTNVKQALHVLPAVLTLSNITTSTWEGRNIWKQSSVLKYVLY